MTTYYYYPSRQTSTRGSAPTFDRMTSSKTRQSSNSPPPLSRASTPASSVPTTPTLPSAPLHSSKMSQPRTSVGFASPIATSAYRTPGWDELSVMKAFTTHAKNCGRCVDPDRVHRHGQKLCRTGTELTVDVGKYFFCSEGRPFSTIDRKQRGERVQVEVPVEYDVIKVLFETLAKGVDIFADLKPKQTEVHQTMTSPSPRRATTTMENVEIKPASSSRRHRTNTYTTLSTTTDNDTKGQRYETRSPDDERYRVEDDKVPRLEKRGSLYVPSDRKSKRRSYVVPTLGIFR